jgi:hypothetical protein
MVVHVANKQKTKHSDLAFTGAPQFIHLLLDVLLPV